MPREIPESDWKIFRELHRITLNRFCEQVLADLEKALADENATPHERYLKIFDLIEKQDDRLADAFNDFRRSTAITQIAMICSYRLFTEEEFMRFSEETRRIVSIYFQAQPEYYSREKKTRS